jgi:hypothetical protein
MVGSEWIWARVDGDFMPATDDIITAAVNIINIIGVNIINEQIIKL